MSVKAFELTAGFEKLPLTGNNSQISCFKIISTAFFVGTNDCFIHHFTYNEQQTATGSKVIFTFEKLRHKNLGMKKPIEHIEYSDKLKKVIVLCEGWLNFLDLSNLEIVNFVQKMKSVSAFCIYSLNNNDPNSEEFIVATRKKMILRIQVKEDKITLLKEFTVSDIPLSLCSNGQLVCYAVNSNYWLVDLSNGESMEVFSLDNEVVPRMVTVREEDFLLNGPSGLGVFTGPGGVSKLPPLSWGDNITDFIFAEPYVVALNDEFITIHSLLDQQQKQALSFYGGRHLQVYNRRVFISSVSDIYVLLPVAWNKQVLSLLLDNQVDEALNLAKASRCLVKDADVYSIQLADVHVRAGFCRFKSPNPSSLLEAARMWEKGGVDLREVLVLYPNLLPDNCVFLRAQPALHDIADICQLTSNDANLLRVYKEFLFDFLRSHSESILGAGWPSEIGTALIKLGAELQHEDLDLLIAAFPAADLESCEKVLAIEQRHHARAVMLRNHNEIARAVDIWRRLIDGELHDTYFQQNGGSGLDCIVDTLCSTDRQELILQHANWLLALDQCRGARLFIQQRCSTQSELPPDQVLTLLEPYPQAVVTYLEFLVMERGLIVERYHTDLALQYLSQVLQLLSEGPSPQLSALRHRLQCHLTKSEYYRPKLLLTRLCDVDPPLHKEAAILHGKLGDDDTALRLMALTLEDHVAAERYCQGKPNSAQLHQRLLALYLEPGQRQRHLTSALDLLASSEAQWDVPAVLKSLPGTWTVKMVSMPFLIRALRQTAHRRRSSVLTRGLAQAALMRSKTDRVTLAQASVRLTDSTRCAVCGQQFYEAVCAVRASPQLGVQSRPIHVACCPSEYT